MSCQSIAAVLDAPLHDVFILFSSFQFLNLLPTTSSYFKGKNIAKHFQVTYLDPQTPSEIYDILFCSEEKCKEKLEDERKEKDERKESSSHSPLSKQFRYKLHRTLYEPELRNFMLSEELKEDLITREQRKTGELAFGADLSSPSGVVLTPSGPSFLSPSLRQSIHFKMVFTQLSPCRTEFLWKFESHLDLKEKQLFLLSGMASVIHCISEFIKMRNGATTASSSSCAPKSDLVQGAVMCDPENLL